MSLRLAPGADVRAEIEVRRSRFLARLRRVASEDEARSLVADARREMPDARHHCSAFMVEIQGTNRVERSSDDGEPPGTAGMPMLEVLRGSGVTDVAAVVTRYFGGVKLGTGGLVRAYGDAVRAALATAALVRPERLPLWTVALPHAEAGRVEAELRARGLHVHDIHYGSEVTLVLAGQDGQRVRSVLATLTSGAAEPRHSGETVVEYPAGGGAP